MKGTYILVISLSEAADINIGNLRIAHFETGFYFYIGSGMGNKGSATLEHRVNRHILPSNKKKIHWHIDYLLNHRLTCIIKIYLIPSTSRLECIIAREIKERSEGFITGFGSSDCQCKSHLFYFRQFKDFIY
ncbi:MAG: DUF123 domain-containing protein [Promethearchaeota archaeon]